MFKQFGRPTSMGCLAAAALLALTGTVAAQSDRDLRDENQRLKTEARQLTRELDAAKDRIEKLERQVESLRTSLASVRRSGPTEPAPMEQEPVSIDESIPTASPRALLSALKKSYAQALGSLERGAEGDTDRAAYMRAVDRWTASANREYRKKIVWHDQILIANPTRRGMDVKLQAVDPKTNTKLGDPFVVALQRSAARRLEQLQQRSAPDVLVLSGTLHPRVVHNPQRGAVKGGFVRPGFIGPYAELRLTVDGTTLLPPTDEDS